jgi:hypothetical protein
VNVPGLRDGVSRLRPHFYWPWRGPINADRAGGVAVPDIITDAPAAIFRAMAGGSDGPAFGQTHGRCALVKHTHTTLEADIMRSYVVRNICAQLERRS